MTTDKRGISALLLQRQLALSRYETAWKLITASSCCVEPSQRSAKPGGDMTHTANVAVPAIRRLDALRIVGIGSRPASDTRPDRPDTVPRSRTSSGTPAGTLERTAEAQSPTTSCGLLKQPDKQETRSNVNQRTWQLIGYQGLASQGHS